MKITTFNPMIISPNAEEVIKLFEALGFEKRHHKTNIENQDITSNRLTDANGFHVDIADVSVMKQDMVTIRMNVDNFDEAYALLTAHGFVNANGHVTETGTSKAALMVSPTGMAINLAQHIK